MADQAGLRRIGFAFSGIVAIVVAVAAFAVLGKYGRAVAKSANPRSFTALGALVTSHALTVENRSASMSAEAH